MSVLRGLIQVTVVLLVEHCTEAQPRARSGTANLTSSCPQHIPGYMRETHGMTWIVCRSPGQHRAVACGCLRHVAAHSGSHPVPWELMPSHHPHCTHKRINHQTPLLLRKKQATNDKMILSKIPVKHMSVSVLWYALESKPC